MDIRVGFDFLGFHIRWKRKRGTNTWHVYTFIADRPLRSVKSKIRALTNRRSQQNPGAVVIRFSRLAHFVWWRVIKWLRALHRWRWKDIRRRFTTPTGQWKPITADGIELFNLASVPITRYRYRYRGDRIPNPWNPLPTNA